MWRRFVLGEVSLSFFIRKRSPPNPGCAIASIIRSPDLTVTGECVTSGAQEPDLEMPKALEEAPREMRSRSGPDARLPKCARNQREARPLLRAASHPRERRERSSKPSMPRPRNLGSG